MYRGGVVDRAVQFAGAGGVAGGDERADAGGGELRVRAGAGGGAVRGGVRGVRERAGEGADGGRGGPRGGGDDELGHAAGPRAEAGDRGRAAGEAERGGLLLLRELVGGEGRVDQAGAAGGGARGV